jgi:hypothetical protein
MKKLFSVVALTALVLSLPDSSFAAKAKPAASPAPPPAATPAATPAVSKPIPMYSEVSVLDAAGKSWTHKNKDGKEVKFVLTATTEVKQNGVAAKFEDIKVGDWVSGLRLKKSDTEYEVIKITKFGAKVEKNPEGTPKTDKKAK